MAGECMEFQVLFLVSFFVVIFLLVAALLRCVLCG